MNTEHKVVEAMASTWDELGYRAPKDWRISCSCGWWARELRDQDAALDAWKAHHAAETAADEAGR